MVGTEMAFVKTQNFNSLLSRLEVKKFFCFGSDIPQLLSYQHPRSEWVNFLFPFASFEFSLGKKSLEQDS